MSMTAKSPKIRLLLVDDHIVLRMGLVTAANGEPDMDVVAEADNGIDAVKAYRAHRPDVVVLDLRMPGRNGIETLRQLREEFGDVRVLVFSNYASGEEVFQAFSAGARGFVVKEMALERLLEAIRKVHAGEQYITPRPRGGHGEGACHQHPRQAAGGRPHPSDLGWRQTGHHSDRLRGVLCLGAF
jgi:DNA-binding NarL/FixJ family response regulator